MGTREDDAEDDGPGPLPVPGLPGLSSAIFDPFFDVRDWR